MSNKKMMIYCDGNESGKATPLKNHKHKGVHYMVVDKADKAPSGFRLTLEAPAKKTTKKKATKKVEAE